MTVVDNLKSLTNADIIGMIQKEDETLLNYYLF